MSSVRHTEPIVSSPSLEAAAVEGQAETLRPPWRIEAQVAVIGLGYVGLPLVELFVTKGFPVLGLDIDPVKVERLQSGQSYIGHIASDRVRRCGKSGRFEATTDFARLTRRRRS